MRLFFYLRVMHLIDTHCHIFLQEFDKDRDEVIQRALANNVRQFILPNVDSSTIPALLELSDDYPGICFPLMGLHPTSVEEDYKSELEIVRNWLEKRTFKGIGEIGLDFYWDTSYKKEQIDSLRIQLIWAKELKLPVVINTRNSFNETIELIEAVGTENLRGIFHCFTGTLEEAHRAIDLGFYLGIGGVLTFKNSNLNQVLTQVDPERIILETDAPYLAPTPKRGKRNEPAYLAYTAKKLSESLNISIDEIAQLCSSNAQRIFLL